MYLPFMIPSGNGPSLWQPANSQNFLRLDFTRIAAGVCIRRAPGMVGPGEAATCSQSA